MARRTFLRYTYGQVSDEHVLQAYLLRLPPDMLYHSWQTCPRLTSASLFDNENPLELEIGCGSAGFLCSLAADAPATNFVGIDISGKALTKAVTIASAQRLQNIKFINANVQLMYPLLEPNSLQAVYLHFPDPHLKPGCQKRRILNSVFLDYLWRALQAEGRLSVMTDVEPFFLDMLALVEQDARFEKTHRERYLVGFEPAVKSQFQRVWERYGERVFRFEVRKHVPR